MQKFLIFIFFFALFGVIGAIHQLKEAQLATGVALKKQGEIFLEIIDVLKRR